MIETQLAIALSSMVALLGIALLVGVWLGESDILR